MAKLGKTGLPKTFSDFMLVGKIKGLDKDKFYEESITRNGKSQRKLKFAVEFEEGKRISVSLRGMEQDKAFFYKQGNKEKNILGETKAVEWAKRSMFKEHGFNPIGTTFRLEASENGEKAEVVSLVDYDAVKEIAQRLKELGEDTIVRVTGELNRYSYVDKKTQEVLSATGFNIKKIFLSNTTLEENDVKNHYFHEQIIVTDIETIVGENGNPTKFLVGGKVCSYNSIETVSLYTENQKLVNTFKKLLQKGYFSVRVHGDIRVTKEEVEVKVNENDDWGETDVSVMSQFGDTNYELWIKGAEQETLDTTTYTKEIIESAIELTRATEAANNDYGDADETTIEVDDDVDLSSWK